MGKKYELVAESMRRLGLRTVEEWQALANMVDWAYAYNIADRWKTDDEMFSGLVAAGVPVDTARALLARGQELGRASGLS